MINRVHRGNYSQRSGFEKGGNIEKLGRISCTQRVHNLYTLRMYTCYTPNSPFPQSFQGDHTFEAAYLGVCTEYFRKIRNVRACSCD